MQVIWYGHRGVAWVLLLPLSWLFGLIVALRYWAFRIGLLASVRVAKPVIVIGNLTVGGTGKTPLVIWLANALAAQNIKVAVIARGYRGAATVWPQAVTASSDPLMVGDEPVLIAQQTSALVFAGPDRVASAESAIAAGAELIISDDGLQHYRLQRDGELVVVDNSRMLGNGCLLPAGPLRESERCLRRVDLVLLNRRNETQPNTLNLPTLEFKVRLTQLRSLKTGEQRVLQSLRGLQVHVVTGIGNPQAFIAALQTHGLKVDARVLPDHAAFKLDDIQFGDALPVLMTEKDAVKCRALAVTANHWAVGAEALLDATTAAAVLRCVQQAMQRRESRSANVG